MDIKTLLAIRNVAVTWKGELDADFEPHIASFKTISPTFHEAAKSLVKIPYDNIINYIDKQILKESEEPDDSKGS